MVTFENVHNGERDGRYLNSSKEEGSKESEAVGQESRNEGNENNSNVMPYHFIAFLHQYDASWYRPKV
ncbi:MAG: hypothetical protein ACK53Y_05540, partial [bacterium]